MSTVIGSLSNNIPPAKQPQIEPELQILALIRSPQRQSLENVVQVNDENVVSYGTGPFVAVDELKVGTNGNFERSSLLNAAARASHDSMKTTTVFFGSDIAFTSMLKAMASTFMVGIEDIAINPVQAYAFYTNSVYSTTDKLPIGHGCHLDSTEEICTKEDVRCFTQRVMHGFAKEKRFKYLLVTLRAKDDSNLSVVFVNPNYSSQTAKTRGLKQRRISSQLVRLARQENTLLVLDLSTQPNSKRCQIAIKATERVKRLVQ